MILNETLPQTRERRGLRKYVASNPSSTYGRTNQHLGVVSLIRYDFDEITSIAFAEDTRNESRRRVVDRFQDFRVNHHHRQLAFYTDPSSLS